MRTGAHTTLGYHDHYVVDGGKRRTILAAFVTPADVTDNMPTRDLLWRVCFRRKIWPHHVTGDAKYGTTANVVAVEDAGIRAYVSLPDFEHRTAVMPPVAAWWLSRGSHDRSQPPSANLRLAAAGAHRVGQTWANDDGAGP